ncbi:MAG TPA: PAS domain S-box protein [Thermoanaerobaculia bacterium]|jgi:PAS domain S-box-containing protein|nr:PAS domain S-box protein [Thermoanaerobaculia bacterium]
MKLRRCHFWNQGRARICTAEGSQIKSIADFDARNAHLRAIAAFSQFADASRELNPILDEAIRVVTQSLGTECCAIFQSLPNDETFALRVSAGWNESSATDDATQRVDIGTWGVLAIRCDARTLRDEEVDFLECIANVLALAVAPAPTQLREHEILQTIFDHTPVMISFRDPAGRLLYVNRAWQETLGWTLEEARETDFFQVLYPDPDSRREVLGFMARGGGEWTDFRLQNRYGRSVETSWARFTLSDGSSIGFGLDISDRKKAERALADSEVRFAKVFQVSPAALAISTIESGRLIDVNDSWLEMFGYGRDEVIGRTNAQLGIAVNPESRAATVRQIRADGVVRNLEVQIRRKSGEIRDLVVSAVAVSLGGEDESWLSTQLDVTDSKRAETERSRLLDGELVARAAAETALERLHAIESITDGALQNLGLDELLCEMLTRLLAPLDANFASVALVDERENQLYMRAVVGDTPHPNARGMRSPLGQGVSGRIATDGQPRIVHDLATVDLSHISGATPEEIRALSRSVVGAPLQVGGKIIGVVAAASPEPYHFNDDDLKLLLVVAARVAPAIERARLIETVHAGRQRLKALSARLITVQEEERRRLAVELHDELGQVLTAVKINIQSLARKLDKNARAELANTIESVDQAVERVRDLALDLRPSVLDDLGLPAALRWYTQRFARDTAIEVDLSTDTALRLELPVETACFRVVQEALTNVTRHARARHVWVALRAGILETELKIRDDGVGFDVLAARERATGGISLGLLGMEERVASLGGEFKVKSVRGKGTRLSARFPVPARG